MSASLSNAPGVTHAEAPSPPRLPRQIPFIIGNETCERFSFYGMRNILTVFLIDYLLVTSTPDLAERQSLAKAQFHLFVSGVYFFPLLGGYLADRFLGKYRTILYLSLVYCGGHALLAFAETSANLFYAGLFLIALGSGGIKPCVSAMVGDQFTQANKALAGKVYAAFYWSINLGSFFASMLIPKTLKLYGPGVAFGIPGLLMLLATFIFWLGRSHYVMVPPTREPFNATRVAARLRSVVPILKVFLPIPFFWMLFDQKASTWVVQAKSMDPKVGDWIFEPSQMQLINPALVMILIPLTSGVLYPLCAKLGYELKPLRRMVIGMLLGAAAYGVAGSIQLVMDERALAGGVALSILWQFWPYLLLTLGEVMLSTTGLEFAYSQAPLEMKGTIMSLWNLNVTAANLVVALSAALNVFSGPSLFFYYGGMAACAALALAWIAKGYQQQDHFQRA